MTKVIFEGCSFEQLTWGHYTGNPADLVVGNEYEVVDVVVHDWHTEVFLRGIIGSFNSACFDGINISDYIDRD